MLFNSYRFLIFFPIVTLLYFLLPARMRWVWLLLCSAYFYMCWRAKYILLIGFSIAVTWAGAWLIDALRGGRILRTDGGRNAAARWVLLGVLAANLGVLFLFKYYNFFAENLAALTGSRLPFFSFALPVGISFYTFQALGYTIDVYRGDIPAERNPFRYALFVGFFPQLVAGPIERTQNLLPQLKKPTRFDYDAMRGGLLLMGWGLFQKIVIADRLSVFVSAVYGDAGQMDGALLLAATVLFAVQIYCDFAAYSTIARGAAQVLGVRLMKNFDHPYFSRSLSEFWQRWHISLSKWFEDYIYMPFVWKWRSPASIYAALLLVFFVSGFWHGANWTFVVWGLLHALYRIVGSLTARPRRRLYKRLGLPVKSRWFACIQVVCTFLLVDFTYIFFRAESLEQALLICRRILFETHWGALFSADFFALGLDGVEWTVAAAAILILWAVDAVSRRVDLSGRILASRMPVRWTVYIAMILVIVLFGVYGLGYDPAPFVYFQF